MTDEERLIKETVARYVNERYLRSVQEHFEAGTFDSSVPTALGELDLLGMHLDGYGLPGSSAVAYGIACMELEAGDSALRSFCSVQGSLAMFSIWKWGSEEQKEKWLPGLAAGTSIGCFGLTEPDSGSDPGSMKTRAVRDGDGWLLNGSKMWITSGSLADVAVVWAATEDGIQGFLVEDGMEGFQAPEMHGKLSLRASVTSELVFDDVTREHVGAARSDVIAFLDSDDTWACEHLALAMALLEGDAGLGVAFAPCKIVDSEGHDTGQRTRPATANVTAAQILAGNPTATCSSLVVRRRVFVDAGHMRSDMVHAEDQEWLFRVVQSGWACRSHTRHSVNYRSSPQGLSSDVQRMYDGWQMFVQLAEL